MCTCTPFIRTPFCGKLGCEYPKPPKSTLRYDGTVEIPVLKYVANCHELQYNDAEVFKPERMNEMSEQTIAELQSEQEVQIWPVANEFYFDDNGQVVISIMNDKQKADLSKALDRALNVWESPPYWLVQLSDKLKGLELPDCQSHGAHNA